MRMTTSMIIMKMMIKNVPGGARDDHVDHEEDHEDDYEDDHVDHGELRMIMKMMMM